MVLVHVSFASDVAHNFLIEIFFLLFFSHETFRSHLEDLNLHGFALRIPEKFSWGSEIAFSLAKKFVEYFFDTKSNVTRAIIGLPPFCLELQKRQTVG